MGKSLILGILFVLFGSTAFAITAVEGKIEKIDRTAKTVVVKTADGTEHIFHFAARTTVHGTEVAAKDSFHGLKEGSDVVVHYTAKGSEETAEEVDHVGENGLKASEGTVTHLDRGAKTVTIKAADGTDHVFRLTDHAAEDAGKDISAGAGKSAKVTVYYTEQAGHQVAHFFKTS
jgi:hypothetical protein